jgi:adenylate cyclase
MQARLAALSDSWMAQGFPRQYMRIGIHTGPASVGNMGGSRRFAYTAVGDTVNLAARLEPLNNEYGTANCISQAALDGCSGLFLTRFLDLVAVKGKTAPVAVYELIGRNDDEQLTRRYAGVLEPYHQAMVLYQAREFAGAAERFECAVTASPEGADPLSQMYLQRCIELLAAPPDATWQPVLVMNHK